VFTVILGRYPGFQQRHLLIRSNQLSGKRSWKVSANLAPSHALRVADLPVPAGEAHLSLPRLGFVSDNGSQRVSSLRLVILQRLWPLSLFLQPARRARLNGDLGAMSTWAWSPARHSAPEQSCCPPAAPPSPESPGCRTTGQGTAALVRTWVWKKASSCCRGCRQRRLRRPAVGARRWRLCGAWGYPS